MSKFSNQTIDENEIGVESSGTLTTLLRMKRDERDGMLGGELKIRRRKIRIRGREWKGREYQMIKNASI